MVGTPKNPPARHKTFGISDSLLDAARQVHEAGVKPQETTEGRKEDYDRPELAARDRKIGRKSSALRSKASVSSNTTSRFKQRHAGKTVPTRKGTEGQPRATGATASRGGSKRPVGGMGAVHHDLANQPEDEFRRKYKKSKSAMRTGLRNSVEYDNENDLNEKENMTKQNYEYNRASWTAAMNNVGKDGLQEGITVQMNSGGTTYKVLSVSKDIGSRIKVGENLSDTAIDDLRDSDVTISYKGGKDGKSMKKMESVDVDADSAAAARKHDCASHVKSEQFGEGSCIKTQHADPDADGHVAWYDVMFEHGIERVMTEDVKVTKSESHMHSSKMKKKKMIVDKDMKEANDDEEMVDCKTCKGSGKIDGEECDHCNGTGKHPKDMEEAKIDPVGKGDADIDNDGDEDDSDEYLHKKRKAIKKSMKKSNIKEWVAMGKTAPGKESVKDAMDAYGFAEHYLNLANRDALFGREDKQKVNEQFAKQFYDQYKAMVAEGDDSAESTFKNEEVIKKLESFKETETSQTTVDEDEASRKIKPSYNTDTHKLVAKKGQGSVRVVPKDYQLKDDEYLAEALTKFGKHMDKSLLDKEKATFKAQGTIKMRKTDSDGIHGTTVQQNDTAKIAALKAKGYVRVSEEELKSESTNLHGVMPHPTEYDAIQRKLKQSQKERLAKERAKQGKTHFQGVNDRRDKGIKSKPIDKNKFFGKTKTGGVQNEDFREVQFEGETIYDSVDSTNLPEHAPEVVEHTPDNYAYNRSSWSNAMNEVNRYKGKSGHRVTQVDKSGDEHIVLQLRKAVTIGPNHTGVKFKDGETHKISAKTAQKHLDHYSKLKPEDKIKWQNSASHSHGGLSSASGEKKLGQAKPKAAFKRDEPTRQLINPMDKD